MIGSMFLTTCNCNPTQRVVPPSLDDIEVSQTLTVTKQLDTGSQTKVISRTVRSGPYCPLHNGTSETHYSGLGGGDFPSPYVLDRIQYEVAATAEIKWANFTAYEDASATGTYYRPGTANVSGGVILATGVNGVRNVYSAATRGPQITGTFSWVRHDTYIDGYPHGSTSYVGCCEPEKDDPQVDPGPASLVSGPVELISGTVEDNPTNIGPVIPAFYIHWIAGAEETEGLTLTLTGTGAALGQWLVSKSAQGIRLSCNTVTHTFSNAISLVTAKAQIDSTTHFTASINSKVNQANALVSDLQPRERFVSASGGCVKLIIVPSSAQLAPSSGTTCRFSAAGSLSTSTVFKFELNNGFVDDESGLRQWMSQVLGYKIGNQDPRTRNLTSDESSQNSNWLTVGLFKPSANAYGTGWEFNSTGSPAIVAETPVTTSPMGFTNTSQTFSEIGCSGEPDAFRFACNYNPCSATCGPCDIGPCSQDSDAPIECPPFVKCVGCYTEYDPDRYPSETFSATTNASGTCSITLG